MEGRRRWRRILLSDVIGAWNLTHSSFFSFFFGGVYEKPAAGLDAISLNLTSRTPPTAFRMLSTSGLRSPGYCEFRNVTIGLLIVTIRFLVCRNTADSRFMLRLVVVQGRLSGSAPSHDAIPPKLSCLG